MTGGFLRLQAEARSFNPRCFFGNIPDPRAVCSDWPSSALMKFHDTRMSSHEMQILSVTEGKPGNIFFHERTSSRGRGREQEEE